MLHNIGSVPPSEVQDLMALTASSGVEIFDGGVACSGRPCTSSWWDFVSCSHYAHNLGSVSASQRRIEWIEGAHNDFLVFGV